MWRREELVKMQIPRPNARDPPTLECGLRVCMLPCLLEQFLLESGWLGSFEDLVWMLRGLDPLYLKTYTTDT